MKHFLLSTLLTLLVGSACASVHVDDPVEPASQIRPPPQPKLDLNYVTDSMYPVEHFLSDAGCVQLLTEELPGGVVYAWGTLKGGKGLFLYVIRGAGSEAFLLPCRMDVTGGAGIRGGAMSLEGLVQMAQKKPNGIQIQTVEHDSGRAHGLKLPNVKTVRVTQPAQKGKCPEYTKPLQGGPYTCKCVAYACGHCGIGAMQGDKIDGLSLDQVIVSFGGGESGNQTGWTCHTGK